MSKKKEILIVEEEEILLKLQSLLLTSRGYEVKGVSSGKMALDCMRRHKPDLVVLDISKEEMDVFEVCEKIKSKNDTKDIPVIIMSNKQGAEAVAKSERVGADCYIIKPFKSSLLVNAVFSLIAGSTEKKFSFA